MQNSMFDLKNFNIIQDEENFYFFRALNNGDSADIEQGLTTDQDGNCIQIRTDRERWLENSTEVPRYGEPAELTLEEIFDHIKMHNRKDTNCISLSSNANISITYGRSNYKDKYALIKVPKIEFGNKVVNAGEYMLAEIEKRIENYISSLDKSDLEVTEILSKIQEIDNANTSEELSEVIRKRYTSKQDITFNNKGMNTKITYSAPVSRISSWQALNEQQVLEKNRLVAKISILEQSRLDFPTIIKSVSNRLLIQTVGNAFSSMEQIHYGNIDKDSIINIPKEIVDIFSLIQQLPKDFEYVEELKMILIKAVEKGGLEDTFKDGFKVLKTIATLFKEYKPAMFFSTIAFIFLLGSLLLGVPVVVEFFETGLVPRFPSLIAAGIFLVVALLLWSCGIILQVIVKKHKQLYELMMNLMMK